MNSIRALLIDISGTLVVGNMACEGAVEGLKKLRNAGIPFRFCTNTTERSSARIVRRLTELGFEVEKKEIFTSLNATRNLVLSRGLKPFVFLEDGALEDFQGIDLNSESPDAVVVGLAPSKLHYEALNKAFRILKDDPSTVLIAIHKSKYFAESDGLSIGPGPFVTALEDATGKKAVVVGKPEKSFYESAIKDMGLLDQTNKIVMIGDDIAQDLGGGAKELGLIRYLVRTGKYLHGDELRDGSIDRVFDNFGQAVDAILGL